MSQPENRVDRIFQEIESFTDEEIRLLLMKMADRIELLGWLKSAEGSFSDWQDHEDSVYNRI
jgi:hypothetical protein